jgi:glutaredoxin 3
MKHKIEVFSAGCKTCKDDMQNGEIAIRAAQHGVRSVPAVVINGKLAGCCEGRGVEENVLREALR